MAVCLSCCLSLSLSSSKPPPAWDAGRGSASSALSSSLLLSPAYGSWCGWEGCFPIVCVMSVFPCLFCQAVRISSALTEQASCCCAQKKSMLRACHQNIYKANKQLSLLGRKKESLWRRHSSGVAAGSKHLCGVHACWAGGWRNSWAARRRRGAGKVGREGSRRRGICREAALPACLLCPNAASRARHAG